MIPLPQLKRSARNKKSAKSLESGNNKLNISKSHLFPLNFLFGGNFCFQIRLIFFYKCAIMYLR